MGRGTRDGCRWGRGWGKRWSVLAGFVGLLVATAGCDGNAELGAAANAKMSADVIADLLEGMRAGKGQNVIAVLTPGGLEANAGGIDPGERISAIEAALERGRSGLLRRVEGKGVRIVAQYRRLPAVHVYVENEAALVALAEANEVTAIELERTFTTFATSANLALIKQAAAAGAGKFGAGTTVAVLDTGTDYRRAPFSCTAPGPDCKVVHSQDFAKDDNMPDDARAHGTNVAGTVLAVAPGAKIAALDVFDGTNATTTTILGAIDWAIVNKAKYNIVALNMSFGGGAFSSPCTTDALAIGIATARASGILSIVASGNEAKSSSIASPACSSKAVSVGAVYDTAYAKLSANVCTDNAPVVDQVACFSNAAPFLNLLAPGVAISAAGLTMTGTSQAAPHVAGAVAVLRAAFPNESLDATVQRLTSSGTQVRDARNGNKTPRLNLEAALAGAAAAPVPAGPAPAPPAPKPGPTGTVKLNDGARFTGSTVVAAAVPVSAGTAAQVCISTGTSCSAWRAYAKSLIVNLSGSDGAKTVRVWWKDAAGNVSAKPATASITLDRTAPVTGKLTLRTSGGTANYSWVGFRDYGSGIARYKLVTRSDAPVPEKCTIGTTVFEGGASAKAATQPVEPGKLYYARLCAIDAVGNVTAGIGGQFETLVR